MSAPRIAVPGATVALSRRCLGRKAFLGAWDRRLDEIWGYSLAYAQVKTRVELHHAVRMPNHHHVEATPTDNRLSEFTALLHRDLSCAVKELLALEGYDTPANLWDDRACHWMRLMDAEAMVSHILYSRLNGVAAGLVERPADLPGVGFDFGLWKGGATPMRRPAYLEYFRRRSDELPLVWTPPAEVYLAFGGDLDKIVYHHRKLEKDLTAAYARQRAGPVFGRDRLERLHPWAEPRTPREGRQDVVPTHKVGAGGAAGVERRRRCGQERTRFWASHRGTRQARKGGDLEAVYPYGTYAAGVQRNEPVEEAPLSDADLAAPGLTLAQAREALARGVGHVERTAVQILEAVRAAAQSEAAAILVADELDFADEAERPTPVGRARPGDRGAEETSDAGSDEAEEPPGDGERRRTTKRGRVKVQHRFDDRPDKASGRRVVTHRDRRGRRRRRRGSGRGNSDPPE